MPIPRLVFFIALVCALFFFSSRQAQGKDAPTASQAASSDIIWQKNLSAAKGLARKNKLPLVIDFSASWCGWCKRLDRDCFQNPTIQRQIKNKAVFLKMDIEASQENKKTYDQTGATGLPLVMIYNLSGDDRLKEKGRIESYLPPERFLARVMNYL